MTSLFKMHLKGAENKGDNSTLKIGQNFVLKVLLHETINSLEIKY